MDGRCSAEFYVLRVKQSVGVLPDYLGAILRSRLVLAQTVHMMTGNTHPRLANDDVINLRIPIPEQKIQKLLPTKSTDGATRLGGCALRQKELGSKPRNGSKRGC